MAADTTGLPRGATRGIIAGGLTGDVTVDVTGGLTVTSVGLGAEMGATGDLNVTRMGPGAELGITNGLTVTRAGTGAISLETPSQAATGPLKVGQTFGPRYHIIKLLGVGGMGAVYQKHGTPSSALPSR